VCCYTDLQYQRRWSLALNMSWTYHCNYLWVYYWSSPVYNCCSICEIYMKLYVVIYSDNHWMQLSSQSATCDRCTAHRQYVLILTVLPTQIAVHSTPRSTIDNYTEISTVHLVSTAVWMAIFRFLFFNKAPT
jgi:hypothetical protein